MFRRVLCKVVGDMVYQGQIPQSITQELVENVAYHNVKNLIKERSK